MNSIRASDEDQGSVSYMYHTDCMYMNDFMVKDVAAIKLVLSESCTVAVNIF